MEFDVFIQLESTIKRNVPLKENLIISNRKKMAAIKIVKEVDVDALVLLGR